MQVGISPPAQSTSPLVIIGSSILQVTESWGGTGNEARQPLGNGNLSGRHLFQSHLNNELPQQQLLLDSV